MDFFFISKINLTHLSKPLEKMYGILKVLMNITLSPQWINYTCKVNKNKTKLMGVYAFVP